MLVALVVLLCKAVLGIARLILKSMALLSHLLSMHLSRQRSMTRTCGRRAPWGAWRWRMGWS